MASPEDGIRDGVMSRGLGDVYKRQVLGEEGAFVMLDCIGDWNGDPGSGWDVAGVTNATRPHTSKKFRCYIW